MVNWVPMSTSEKKAHLEANRGNYSPERLLELTECLNSERAGIAILERRRSPSMFKRLVRDLEALKELDRTNQDEKYWEDREVWVRSLKALIDDSEALRKLTKNQLFVVLGWCSSYRPEEPYVTLGRFGGLVG